MSRPLRKNRVDLTHRCTGLRFTEDIGFRDRDGQICPLGGDAVVVPGPTGERCSIASIERLGTGELDLLLPDRNPESEDEGKKTTSCNDISEELEQ